MLPVTLEQDSPPSPVRLWPDESRDGMRARTKAEPAHPPAQLRLPPPEKTEGATIPHATFKINLVLQFRGGSKSGSPEVAFALTKASLQCGELV